MEGVAVEERVEVHEAEKTEEVSAFEEFVEDTSGIAVVRVMISLLVAIVIGLGVVYPVMKDVIAQTNATGTEAMMLSMITTLFVAAMLYAVIAVFF